MPNVVQKGSVMVWGGINIDGCTDLVVCGNLIAAEYIEQILLHHMLVAAYGVGPEFVLMYNNARSHVARIIRAVLRDVDIQETLQDLKLALIEEWNLIPQCDLCRLIQSMLRRCQAVIHVRGGHTPY